MNKHFSLILAIIIILCFPAPTLQAEPIAPTLETESNKKERAWLTAEELQFDWGNLAGKDIEIRTNILGANISDRTLNFIDGRHRIVVESLNRDKFLWIYKNCNINYICGASVKGVPEDIEKEQQGILFAQMMGVPVDTKGTMYNDFYAREISFYIYLATGVADNGVFYSSFLDTDSIVNSAREDMSASGEYIECCEFFSYWVSLESILSQDYILNYSYHEDDEGNIRVFEHEGIGEDNGSEIVNMKCLESLNNLPWHSKLGKKCYSIKDFKPFHD